MRTDNESPKGTFLIVTGLLLIAAALFLTGYNLFTQEQAGNKSETVLTELMGVLSEKKNNAIILHGETPKNVQFDMETGQVIGEEMPDYELNPDMNMPDIEVDGKKYIGVLQIPSLSLALPVMNNWSYPNLRIAPCRYTGSVYKDDMVICAHNYSRHFGRIGTLSQGDEVTFTDADGNVFLYQVMDVETLGPYQEHEMTTGDWDLTLFTCTIGGATRVTVRCERLQ